MVEKTKRKTKDDIIEETEDADIVSEESVDEVDDLFEDLQSEIHQEEAQQAAEEHARALSANPSKPKSRSDDLTWGQLAAQGICSTIDIAGLAFGCDEIPDKSVRKLGESYDQFLGFFNSKPITAKGAFFVALGTTIAVAAPTAIQAKKNINTARAEAAKDVTPATEVENPETKDQGEPETVLGK